MSKNRAAAIEQCRKLLYRYRPRLDKLLVATSDNVDGLVAEEEQLGRDIYNQGVRAFGPTKAVQLVYKFAMPIRPAEEAEMIALGIVRPDKPQQVGLGAGSTSPTMTVAPLSEAHRQAMMACVWRSHRLAELLQTVPPRAASEAEIRDAYARLMADDPDADDREVRRRVEAELGKTTRQVRQAIRQPNR